VLPPAARLGLVQGSILDWHTVIHYGLWSHRDCPNGLPLDIGPNLEGCGVDLEADVLRVGTGCGGVAGALAAAVLSRNVVLAAPSRWLSGQLHAQAVLPDEQP
jgi:hypothetical protein